MQTVNRVGRGRTRELRGLLWLVEHLFGACCSYSGE